MNGREFDYFTLTEEQSEMALAKGFTVSYIGDRWYFMRIGDSSRIWPHIDGYIHAFVRQGHMVKHKKFLDLAKALDRRFGDD